MLAALDKFREHWYFYEDCPFKLRPLYLQVLKAGASIRGLEGEPCVQRLPHKNSIAGGFQ